MQRWRSLFLIGICLTFLNTAIGAGQADSAAFFVATNGNDAWSGKLIAPNRNRTDGPFATVTRAVTAVRESRSHTSNVSQRATILIREGLYFLDKPLVLGPEDSQLLLGAYRTEKPVLSGGRRITGWKEAEFAGRKLWAADVPEVRDRKWFFRELWIN